MSHLFPAPTSWFANMNVCVVYGINNKASMSPQAWDFIGL